MTTDTEKEKKYDKKIRKVMKRSAILVGCGLGFLILLPFLPDISDVERSQEMKSLFSLTGFSVIGYGALMTFICIFFRPKAVMFDGIMNFFVVPVYAIWFLMEAYAIIGG